MTVKEIVLLLHNIRSIHNVGSMIRTADGFGVGRIIYSGYTPYPLVPDDTRLPHLSRSITERLHKTALGAELSVSGSYTEGPDLAQYKSEGYRIVGLEQASTSILLSEYVPSDRTLLIVGEEVAGIPGELLNACDDIVEIPMNGKKESFNVSVATAIALYHFSIAG